MRWLHTSLAVARDHLARTAPARAARVGHAAAPVPTAPEPPVQPAPRGSCMQRFELKYWVPMAAAERVVRYARPYMELDPFCVASPDHSQWNSSLYLDTPRFDLYQQHMERAPDRIKLRVRAYGQPAQGLAFFEIKRKVNQIIVKDRAAVPVDRVRSVLDGTYDELPTPPRDRDNLGAFLYWQTVHRARPRVLVRCQREAWASPEPLEEVRLTFDRGICFQPVNEATLEGDPTRFAPIDGIEQHEHQGGPFVLVELKFNGVAPLWTRALIGQLEMFREGYSKYCAAVTSLLEEASYERSLWDSAGLGDR